MKFLITLFICLCSINIHAQNSFKAIIKSAESKELLAGATVTIKELNQAAIADSIGNVVINNIPDGKFTVDVSYSGYQSFSEIFFFPLNNELVEILLEEGEEHEEEVIISTTRTSRTISNTPTRVEVISGEELDEKGNMKPGDIRMLLNESTGIQTQQTSATSYNSSIRIQGLDGRYTQILKDGFPVYSGFAGGLSIMQIAPLDLRQVEVIKGSSSTLYGGGAIAGIVNLVTKTPRAEKELSFMANGTSAKGLDLSSFYSQRFNRFGVTVFGSANFAQPYDPANIGFTAIPKFTRYTISPRLFYYGDKTTMNAGVSYITENRIGGSIDYIKNNGPGFFERNNTDRLTTQFAVAHQVSETGTLNFKNSYNRFNRFITIPNYNFEGQQQSSYTEATFTTGGEQSTWIIGANVVTDKFNEVLHAAPPARDYLLNTYGLFVQNTWTPNEQISLETGLRGDHVSDYGFELLPRIAALYKVSSKLSLRMGGGFGYKSPTLFNEEAERLYFRNILPVTSSAVNERSVGANFDVNYRTTLGDVGVSFNHLFFYTRLNNPLLLIAASNNNAEFRNANGYMDSKGMETNIKMVYGDFKLFIGYTLADVNTHYNNVKDRFPLTARHRLNNVLMYEVEDKWKVGLEAYYTSQQVLNDNSFGKPYWVTGFMVEKLWEQFSIFLNFENFTDTRQTKFDTIYTGSIINPVFRDIYAPVDGFVVNGGFKIRL
ncbi:MAG TPA: TonB-dependent receptor [Flavisolibacter sp.]|nr:TonB-dependent receptor [Flavisolibacter sp.]